MKKEPITFYKTICDPLADTNQAIEYHKMHGVVFDKIQIPFSKFNFLLEKSDCKNEDELRELYKKRFGTELCKIELLEG